MHVNYNILINGSVPRGKCLQTLRKFQVDIQCLDLQGRDPGFGRGGGLDRDRPKLPMVCSSIV